MTPVERSLNDLYRYREWLEHRWAGDGLSVRRKRLTSLDGVPKIIGGEFDVDDNLLTSLKGIHTQIIQMRGQFSALNNPIESHVLGLILIRGITTVMLDNWRVAEILNRHLGKGRAGMLMAQEELIEAGFEKFAQL